MTKPIILALFNFSFAIIVACNTEKWKSELNFVSCMEIQINLTHNQATKF